MQLNDQARKCQPKPLLVDETGNLSMDAEIVGEVTMTMTEWMAMQEIRISQGLPIETPPPLD